MHKNNTNNGKVKMSVYLEPKTKENLETYYKSKDFRTQSEFVDAAINFYIGYLTAEDCKDFYPNVMLSCMQGAMDSFENRLGRLVFKQSVELAMIMNLIAATSDIYEEDLVGLREKCIDEVKRLNGRINFEDVYRHYRNEF